MKQLTQEEAIMFQVMGLLAIKHKCSFEIDLKTKEISFTGSMENETALALDIQSYFGKLKGVKDENLYELQVETMVRQ